MNTRAVNVHYSLTLQVIKQENSLLSCKISNLEVEFASRIFFFFLFPAVIKLLITSLARVCD